MEAGQDNGRRREEARGALRQELQEVVGEDAAERAERRGALDSALEAGRPRTVLGALKEARGLVAITFFTALIVGAVIALITGSWWFLLVALVLHAIGTIVVVATTFSLVSQVESPDPRTAAALEARGVSNPDAALNEAVSAASDDSDEAASADDQQSELTPSPRSHSTSTSPDGAEGDRR
ncbi:MAG TPA: VirB3 family type IV secretion system protein [Thermoleophilaceae bacterium]|nr:VirB3 family type IV secretion system protein [Thermoleophilaceae bacterium]